MKIRLQMDSLDTADGEVTASVVVALVEALATANSAFLHAHPDTPSLYRSGVRFDETASWLDVPALLARGGGDCKSLVAWRIAEARLAGKTAKVHVLLKEEDPLRIRMHLQVEVAGRIEDPSRTCAFPLLRSVPKG